MLLVLIFGSIANWKKKKKPPPPAKKTEKLKNPKPLKSQNKTIDSYEALWQSNNKSRKNV